MEEALQLGHLLGGICAQQSLEAAGWELWQARATKLQGWQRAQEHVGDEGGYLAAMQLQHASALVGQYVDGL